MGILDKTVFALIGPIDNAADDGVGFRQEIMAKLKGAGLDVGFFDPTNKPTGGFKEIGEEKVHAFKLREEGRFEELARFVKGFRRQDLRAVEVSDIVIAYIDPTIHMCGTYDELYTSVRSGKPVFAIIKGGRTKCPLWLFDVIRLENMFDSVDACIDRLAHIDRSELWFDTHGWLKAHTIVEGN